MALFKSVFGGSDRSRDGIPARAIVRYAHCGLSPGERASKVRTRMDLTLADGAATTLVESLPWKLAVAVSGWVYADAPDWTDTDVAIRVDPHSAEALGLDRPVVERELADRMALIDQRWSMKGQFTQQLDQVRGEVTGLRSLPGDLADAARRLKEGLGAATEEQPVVVPEHLQLDDGDPDLAPVEGVTYEQWVSVQGAMLRDKVKAKGRGAYADAHGIPEGRWDAITAVWTKRSRTNRNLAIRMSQDLERIRRGT